MNPWLPTRPGEHGYMFFGLEGRGKDDKRFEQPTERAIFVQEGKGRWRYFGLYIAHRVPNNDLSKEEWRHLHDQASVRVYLWLCITMLIILVARTW